MLVAVASILVFVAGIVVYREVTPAMQRVTNERSATLAEQLKNQ